LDELDLTRSTLLIVTSDHGESLSEHDLFGHNLSLYDPELRVPLILHCPTLIPAGKRIATQIGLIDLAPTVLDLLHVEPLKQAQGGSVAALILGRETDGDRPRFCQLWEGSRAVRTNRSKLIRSSDGSRLELYDLSRDPGETAPLRDIEGNADGQQALRLLREHELECESLRTQLASAAGGRPTSESVQLDEQTRQRLRALGYDVPESR